MRSLTLSFVRCPSSGSVHACSFSATWYGSERHAIGSGDGRTHWVEPKRVYIVDAWRLTGDNLEGNARERTVAVRELHTEALSGDRRPGNGEWLGIEHSAPEA